MALNSFYGADHVIRAVTVIEQRPSGRHYERWQERIEIDPRGGFLYFVGGLDPYWYPDEAEAVAAFDHPRTA